MCAAVQAFMRATSTTSSGNDSASRLWRAGDCGEQRKSRRVRDHQRLPCPDPGDHEPAGSGSVTNGMLPMPRTSPSFVADPVVARTNQGSANTVIDEPTDDTTSAATIARIRVELTLLIRFRARAQRNQARDDSPLSMTSKLRYEQD
jgi:hypothetical protein